MWRRVVFAVALLPVCWLGMMLVHEGGHMLAAVCTGGTVTRLVWPLWGFSRTDLGENPHPLIVVWGGPLCGALFPVLASVLVRGIHRKSGPVSLELFSGFCLLANGLYLSVGTIASRGGVGDIRDLIKWGTPVWLLWLVGLTLTAAGLFQWHRLGNAMGLARVSSIEMWIVLCTSVALIVAAACASA